MKEPRNERNGKDNKGAWMKGKMQWKESERKGKWDEPKMRGTENEKGRMTKGEMQGGE